MAFEHLRTNQVTDAKLGKPVGLSTAPWFDGSPQQDDLRKIKEKAQLVKKKQSKFTSEEIHQILASLVLANE